MLLPPVVTPHPIHISKLYHRGSGVQEIRFNHKNDYKSKYQVSIYEKLKKEDEELRQKKIAAKAQPKIKIMIENAGSELVYDNRDNEENYENYDNEVNYDSAMNHENRENYSNRTKNSGSRGNTLFDNGSEISVGSEGLNTKKHLPIQMNTKKFKSFICSLNLAKLGSKSNDEYQRKVKSKIWRNPIIVDKIISNFDPLVDKDKAFLVNSLLLLSKEIHSIVEKQLYSKVRFESTYRLAQFLNTLKKSNAEYAKGIKSYQLSSYVLSLDLSLLLSGSELYDKYYRKQGNAENDSEDLSLATWRDWRMRESQIYGNKIRDFSTVMRKRAISSTSIVSMSTESAQNSNQKRRRLSFGFLTKKLRSKDIPTFKSTNSGKADMKSFDKIPAVHEKTSKRAAHPLINFHLAKYKDNRDVPIGFILHFLKLCTNLHELNLDRLSISDDILLFENKRCFKDMNIDDFVEYFVDEQQVLFLSDTGLNKFNIKSHESYTMITFSNFFQIFVKILKRLDIPLTSLSFKHCYFVTKIQVQNMLLHFFRKSLVEIESNKLKLDFYKATMNRDYQWCNTKIKSWHEFASLMFMCNLSAASRYGGKLFNKIDQSAASDSASFFETYILNIDGHLDGKSDVAFRLCYMVADKKHYKLEYETIKNRLIVKINIFLELEKFMRINEFTIEKDFVNFHENMSSLRLTENIRKGNMDYRYYDMLIVGEYLLILLNKDYYAGHFRNVGFNSFAREA